MARSHCGLAHKLSMYLHQFSHFRHSSKTNIECSQYKNHTNATICICDSFLRYGSGILATRSRRRRGGKVTRAKRCSSGLEVIYCKIAHLRRSPCHFKNNNGCKCSKEWPKPIAICKRVAMSTKQPSIFAFAVACFDGGAIGHRRAPVVKLVDAPHSKSRLA